MVLDPATIGAACLAALALLICAHVPISVAMIAVGVGGFALQTGWTSAASVLGSETASQLANIDLATVPLFILMGTFASAAGFSKDIYALASAFLGHRRGGLGYATIAGCAVFGSICGSTTATAATFARVGLPEMEARGYTTSFSLATIAAGGTLKALIPPSLVMILYSITAKVFIFEIFAAAIIPALITILLNLFAIWLLVRLNPEIAPRGARKGSAERIAALRQAVPAIVLLGIVFVGLYSGIFTVNEAASVAAVLSFLTMLVRRRANWTTIRDRFYGTATTTGMIYGILIGSAVFGYPINLAQIPNALATVAASIDIAPVLLILVILVFYIALGAVFDELAAMLITLPLILPVVVKLGYDPVWWGVMNVIIIELGLIVPPVGFIVLLLNGMVPRMRLGALYKAVTPFIAADTLVLLILLLFPGLALILPRLLY